MDNYTLEDVLVFKTSVQSENDIYKISPYLNADTRVRKWNVDLDDVDCVLRIESDVHDPGYVIELIRAAGFLCEELTS